MGFKVHQFKKRQFLRLFSMRYKCIMGMINNCKKILDLGCGPGKFLPSLARYGNVIGLDLFPLDYDRSAKKEIKSFKNVDLIKGDIEKLPFLNNSVDLIIAADVLEHIPNVRQALEEILRTLKPEGSLIISIPTENLIYKILRFFFRGTFKLSAHLHTRMYLRSLIDEKMIIKSNSKIPFNFLFLWEILRYEK